MEELKELGRVFTPHEILFVADSMTGQDAVNVAKTFNDALALDGVILTKLDGDAHGGAASPSGRSPANPLSLWAPARRSMRLNLFTRNA